MKYNYNIKRKYPHLFSTNVFLMEKTETRLGEILSDMNVSKYLLRCKTYKNSLYFNISLYFKDDCDAATFKLLYMDEEIFKESEMYQNLIYFQNKLVTALRVPDSYLKGRV
jgi:hypothetical protein